jgi:hypothetical protein
MSFRNAEIHYIKQSVSQEAYNSSHTIAHAVKKAAYYLRHTKI